jgi:hypothetical protein
MTMDAYAPSVDPKTFVLGRLVTTLAEDAIFGLMTGAGSQVLEGLGRRRGEAYSAILSGHRLNTLSTETDPWVVEMTRAVAPIHAPDWLPMADVIREKVTLEAGARGIRSLFSSKPSDKDVQRVKRLGTLAVRVLRAVYAADGPLDPEETRSVAGLVASLGLPDEIAQPLFHESPIGIDQLDVYGDIEPAIAKALVRGGWLAAAWDAIDPREEHVVRVLANKLAFPAMDMEVLRNEAVQRMDQRRAVGLAAVDAIRFVLSDRVPGHGVTLAAKVGSLVVHGMKVTLARRYIALPAEERLGVLSMTWAAALYEDPSVARRALLRARHDRVAADLGEDGNKARHGVEDWMYEVLAPAAYPLGGDG